MKSRNKRLSLVIVAAIVIIVGALAVVIWRGTRSSEPASSQTSTSSKGLQIERSSSGGLSGRGDGKNFRIVDSQLTYGDKQQTLSQDQLKTIEGKVKAANFFNLDEHYQCLGCADQFVNALTITLDGNSRMVIFEDGSNPPTSLLELDAYLRDLLF